jgi:hypothetical protein
MCKERREETEKTRRFRPLFKTILWPRGEEEETDELDPEIHCFGDTPPFPHLTQSAYEESLMDSQLNELSKGDKASGGRGRYNLRSDKKTAAPDIPEQSTRTEKPANEVADGHRGKKAQPLSPIVHNHAPEIREIPKLASSFNFEHEIQKIRIPVPLTELIKHGEFKKRFSELLQSEASCLPTDSINLQDEKPAVVLGPMVEDRDDSSPPFYTSLNIHDKVLHNCLMDSGASHNLMPKTVMEELGLEVTRAYHDLYSFDSRKSSVSRSYQRPGRDLVSAAHEKCGHGYCSGRCPPQVRYAVIKILDKKTGGNLADGPHICYYPSVWRRA